MILTFLGFVFLRLGVSDSYVWVLVFLLLGVSFLTFAALVMLTFGD